MRRRTFIRGITGAAVGISTVAVMGRGIVAQEVGTPAATQDTANSFVFGNGLDLIPAGAPNTVEIVAQGSIQSSYVPFVLRNTTQQTIVVSEIIGTIRDGAGKLLDTVSYAEYAPQNLLPSGVSFGYATFSEDSLPLDVTVELVVNVELGPSGDYLELPITEVEANSDGFVGAVENSTGFPLDYITVVGVTLAQDGTPIGHFNGYVDQDTLPAGETGFFDGYLQGQPSQRFLVAAYARN